MSKLVVKPEGTHGRVTHVTPQSAGWTYVGFDLWKLAVGESARGEDAARETCLVFVAGKGRVTVDGKELGEIGERLSPFEDKPWSVYVPAKAAWSVTATTALELAVCSAPATGMRSPSTGPTCRWRDTTASRSIRLRCVAHRRRVRSSPA